MVLLIDNYDSFTWNLAHRLGELGADVLVRRNDELAVSDIMASPPGHLVISPGPGRPEAAGISVEAIRACAGRVPILGVCLGHQALATAFGGIVERAPRPMHGKTSRVKHTATGVFAGLDGPFDAGRYHSLCIPADALPDGFDATAWAEDDGVVMGVAHRTLAIHGVQFHPESVLTPIGQRILQNFLESRA